MRLIAAQCDALIAGIDIPRPFSTATLCEQLGGAWGSTVCLYPTTTMPNGPCGGWVSLEVRGRRYDVIAYERDASAWLQIQMIGHEIGHRMLGHSGTTPLPVDPMQLASQMFPAADAGLIDHVVGCGREPSAYDDPEELAAEYVGTRLLDRAMGWRAGPLSCHTPVGLARLHAALGLLDTCGRP